ncbi:MAG: thioredoxin domain-containing protein [Gemmatimonadaceae bacterium]
MFFGLIGAILVLGAAGIYYKVQSAPKPIVLSPSAVLPKAEGYLLGDPNAKVTIIEFADFECPQCANFSNVTEPDVRKRIIETGLANMRFYDYPLTGLHPNTLFASLAASCAADQGKFWEMHDLLLSGQEDWEGRLHKNPVPVFQGYVKKLGLDASKYDKCFDSRENVARIQAHQKAGDDLRIESTPSFVIGGTLYAGIMASDRMKQLVELEHAKIALADSTKAKLKK